MQQLLDAFDALSETEKDQAATELLNRILDLAPADLPDKALVAAAEELFRELDAREEADGRP